MAPKKNSTKKRFRGSKRRNISQNKNFKRIKQNTVNNGESSKQVDTCDGVKADDFFPNKNNNNDSVLSKDKFELDLSDVGLSDEDITESDSDIDNNNNREENIFINKEFLSASDRKHQLNTSLELDKQLELQQNSGFILLHSNILQSVLKDFLCPTCKQSGVASEINKTSGFSTEIFIHCRNCDFQRNVWSSPRNNQRSPYEINKRIVFASKDIGIGCASLNKFSADSGIIGSMHHKTYGQISQNMNKTLHNASTLDDARTIVHNVEKELGNFNEEGMIDIMVSYDGSWQKRGYSSLHGIGFIIHVVTGLVVDYGVLSKYCHKCRVYGDKLT